MHVPGFWEIMPYAEAFDINGVEGLKVCTLEGLVLLKLIANDDTTTANNYMQLVAARIIGRKIRGILDQSGDLQKRILSILHKRTIGELWLAMADGMRDTE